MEISIDDKASYYIKSKWPTIVIDVVKDYAHHCDMAQITIGEPKSPEKYNWQYVNGINIFLSDIFCKRNKKVSVVLGGHIFARHLNLVCSNE